MKRKFVSEQHAIIVSFLDAGEMYDPKSGKKIEYGKRVNISQGKKNIDMPLGVVPFLASIVDTPDFDEFQRS